MPLERTNQGPTEPTPSGSLISRCHRPFMDGASLFLRTFFPVLSELIPCYSAQGICSQLIDTASDFRGKVVELSSEQPDFPVNSLLSGNFVLRPDSSGLAAQPLPYSSIKLTGYLGPVPHFAPKSAPVSAPHAKERWQWDSLVSGPLNGGSID